MTRFETVPDGVTCVYDSLQNDRESIPIKVRYQIRALNQQILFSIEVENPTGRKLTEVMYGIIGGQQGIDNRLDTESVVPGENTNLAPHLFRQFQSGGYGGGNLGIRYDANGFLYPGNMPVFFDLLEKEPDSSVRAVLGHWLLGYVHPYPDGNGRVARFLMNVMLASGGYPWTIIRVEDRDDYLAALDRASIDMDIKPFTQFVAERVKW